MPQFLKSMADGKTIGAFALIEPNAGSDPAGQGTTAERRGDHFHGGYGVLKEYPLERYCRDARVFTIYEGTSEIQRMVISNGILKDKRR